MRHLEHRKRRFDSVRTAVLLLALAGFLGISIFSFDTVQAGETEEWALILANKQTPIPKDYEAELTFCDSAHEVDERIAKPLSQMIAAAGKDGVILEVCSAHRSYERQVELFRNKIDGLMRSGLSYYEAYKTASYSVTVPGTSEHQLGLALDIVTPGYTDLDAGFGETEAGKWLAENSADHGFILRYPLGKEHITGIIYEPWHFRYVGVKAAKEITKRGITLEEYLEDIIQ
ncbi:MAG: M15 family metallopeptidase [Lachnospiraceae bacterium]|nr:M15 family metallopeptidase [Lachnospiraceae bacterium]